MYLKKVAPKIPPDTVRLMARIILKLRNGGAKECDVLPDGQQRYFDDLLTHQKEIVRDSSRIEAFQNFYLVLKDCLDKFLPPKSEVLDIYGRILINSFNLMNDKFQSVGVGLYLGASVLDHSCQPNAVVIFKGKELIVRTIEDVENISDIRVSYTNLLDNTEKRRQNLCEQYYFFCECPKCQDMEQDLTKSSMMCPDCGGCVPHKKGSCTKCNKTIEPSLITSYSNLKMRLLEECKDELETYENLFAEAVTIFHPNDKDYLDLLEVLYEKRLAVKNYPGCLEVCRLILAHYDTHYPERDVNKGITEMKAAKISAYLNQLEEAELHICKAKTNLATTHGDVHPLVSKDWRNIRQDIDMGKREVKDISLIHRKNGKKSQSKSG